MEEWKRRGKNGEGYFDNTERTYMYSLYISTSKMTAQNGQMSMFRTHKFPVSGNYLFASRCFIGVRWYGAEVQRDAEPKGECTFRSRGTEKDEKRDSVVASISTSDIIENFQSFLHTMERVIPTVVRLGFFFGGHGTRTGGT